MLPDNRLQQLIKRKKPHEAVGYEFWSIIDNALVIHDGDDPPHWLPKELDEDGNTPEFLERKK
jgi:hypothetical protein